MTYYGKFTPYLQLSTLPDRSNNVLQPISSEEFTATKSVEDLSLSMVPDGTNTEGHAYLLYDISSWSSVDYAVLYNHSDSAQAVYFLYKNDRASPTDVEYTVVNPGRFAVIPNILTATGSLSGHTASLAILIADYTSVGNNATLDIYVVGS